MFAPKKAKAQEKEISPELKEERSKVSSLYDILAKEQSNEYKVAAKAFNINLRSSGLDSLMVVEK